MSGISDYSPSYLQQDRGYQLLVVCAIFIALETLAVTLRFYTRHLTKAGFGWDDLILLPGLLVNYGLCALAIVMVRVAGVGHHVPTVSEVQLARWAQCVYAVPFVYLTAVLLPKLSILGLYLRIFTTRGPRWTVYILMGVIFALWIAFLFSAAFQCTPTAFAWNKTIVGGHCLNIQAQYESFNPPTIATDSVMLILPMPTVWRLQISRTKKVGLTCIFLAGTIGVIASCVRLAIFFQNDAFTDGTWSSVPLVTWSVVEAGMYMIVACLPILRPLFSKYKDPWSRLKSRIYTNRSRSTVSDLPRGTTIHGDYPNSYPSLGFQKLGSSKRSYSTKVDVGSVPPDYSGKFGTTNGIPSSGRPGHRGIEITHDVDIDLELLNRNSYSSPGVRRVSEN